MTWHAQSRSWFASSLGGGVSLERDGHGGLTRQDVDGEVVAARWIDGLDAPTGMASGGDRLFVGDRGMVVKIDVPEARIVARHPVTGALSVNDVAAANGDFYVRHFMGNRIYRLPAATRAAKVFVASDALDYPNGLVVDGDRLVVATWGVMTDLKTLAVSLPGTVLTVDLTTRAIRPLADGRPKANFDGIVTVGDGFYATDWMRGRLLRIARDEAAHCPGRKGDRGADRLPAAGRSRLPARCRPARPARDELQPRLHPYPRPLRLGAGGGGGTSLLGVNG